MRGLRDLSPPLLILFLGGRGKEITSAHFADDKTENFVLLHYFPPYQGGKQHRAKNGVQATLKVEC